jgi:REP element-mobilizing transposase RayT
MELMRHWKDEYEFQRKVLSTDPDGIRFLDRDFWKQIEEYLDKASEVCLLKEPRIAGIVSNALRHFNEQRYHLHAWTIMPNHVHALLFPFDTNGLSSIIHSWKSYTATQANLVLERKGRFWDHEYFDRVIRSARHFEFTTRYILNNPVKAGLCNEPHQWPWFGCCDKVQNYLRRFC